MTAVFLDTVGLLALWDVADQWHPAAEEALECGNAAARRPYRAEPDQVRRVLESRNELVAPTVEDWQAAWESYRRADPGDAGIVDCMSFLVMHRLGVNQAFTNDRHFVAAGLTVLF